jgi:hypothetical protein
MKEKRIKRKGSREKENSEETTVFTRDEKRGKVFHLDDWDNYVRVSVRVSA